MVLNSLRAYLDLLRGERNLVEVSAAVDPRLEIAEIHRRVIAAGGPTLLFSKVKGSPHAAVTNLFGTARRIELAFGRRPLEFVKQAVRAAHELLPPTPAKAWSFRGFALEGLKVGMARRKTGPVLEAVERPADLTQLPAITSWPEDGGPFITLPLVYTEHPHDGSHNLGMYRMHVYDARATGMHWQ